MSLIDWNSLYSSKAKLDVADATTDTSFDADQFQNELTDKYKRLEERTTQKANRFGYMGEAVRIRRVIDGDTVDLEDGSRIRLSNGQRFDANEVDHTGIGYGKGKSKLAMDKQRELTANMYGVPISDVTDQMMKNVGGWQTAQLINKITGANGMQYENGKRQIDDIKFDKDVDWTGAANIDFGEEGLKAGLLRYKTGNKGRIVGKIMADNGHDVTSDMAKDERLNAFADNFYDDRSFMEKVAGVGAAATAGGVRNLTDTAKLVQDVGLRGAYEAMIAKGMTPEEANKKLENVGVSNEALDKLDSVIMGSKAQAAQQHAYKKMKQAWERGDHWEAVKWALSDPTTTAYSGGYMVTMLVGGAEKAAAKTASEGTKIALGTIKANKIAKTAVVEGKEGAEEVLAKSTEALSKIPTKDRFKAALVENADTLHLGALMTEQDADQYYDTYGERMGLGHLAVAAGLNSVGAKVDIWADKAAIGATKPISSTLTKLANPKGVEATVKRLGKDKAKKFILGMANAGMKFTEAGLSEFPAEYIQQGIQTFDSTYGGTAKDGHKVGFMESLSKAHKEAVLAAVQGAAGGVHMATPMAAVGLVKDTYNAVDPANTIQTNAIQNKYVQHKQHMQEAVNTDADVVDIDGLFSEHKKGLTKAIEDAGFSVDKLDDHKIAQDLYTQTVDAGNMKLANRIKEWADTNDLKINAGYSKKVVQNAVAKTIENSLAEEDTGKANNILGSLPEDLISDIKSEYDEFTNKGTYSNDKLQNILNKVSSSEEYKELTDSEREGVIAAVEGLFGIEYKVDTKSVGGQLQSTGHIVTEGGKRTFDSDYKSVQSYINALSNDKPYSILDDVLGKDTSSNTDSSKTTALEGLNRIAKSRLNKLYANLKHDTEQRDGTKKDFDVWSNTGKLATVYKENEELLGKVNKLIANEKDGDVLNGLQGVKSKLEEAQVHTKNHINAIKDAKERYGDGVIIASNKDGAFLIKPKENLGGKSHTVEVVGTINKKDGSYSIKGNPEVATMDITNFDINKISKSSSSSTDTTGYNNVDTSSANMGVTEVAPASGKQKLKDVEETIPELGNMPEEEFNTKEAEYEQEKRSPKEELSAAGKHILNSKSEDRLLNSIDKALAKKVGNNSTHPVAVQTIVDRANRLSKYLRNRLDADKSISAQDRKEIEDAIGEDTEDAESARRILKAAVNNPALQRVASTSSKIGQVVKKLKELIKSMPIETHKDTDATLYDQPMQDGDSLDEIANKKTTISSRTEKSKRSAEVQANESEDDTKVPQKAENRTDNTQEDVDELQRMYEENEQNMNAQEAEDAFPDVQENKQENKNEGTKEKSTKTEEGSNSSESKSEQSSEETTGTTEESSADEVEKLIKLIDDKDVQAIARDLHSIIQENEAKLEAMKKKAAELTAEIEGCK